MMAAHQRLLDKQAEQREADLKAFRQRTANRSQAAGDMVSTLPCRQARCVTLTLRLRVTPPFPRQLATGHELCRPCLVHLGCPQLRGALPVLHSKPTPPRAACPQCCCSLIY